MLGLNRDELRVLRSLSTPIKIQDFLDALPTNWEKRGDTLMSPRRVLRERKAHCIEGALLAAAALWLRGERPLLLDLRDRHRYDAEDHVATLYKRNGLWGAISKTNHSTLRFRDPVYRTVRELVMSYFHEFFMNETAQKTLEDHSRPFDMRRFGEAWVTAEEDLWWVQDALNDVPHERLFPKESRRFIRGVDSMELRAGKLTEWKKSDPRT